MQSEDDEDQFYFSFYELNNGEIIELTLIENFKDNKLNATQFEFSYTKMKLKNGEIINYKFGDAFILLSVFYVSILSIYISN